MSRQPKRICRTRIVLSSIETGWPSACDSMVRLNRSKRLADGLEYAQVCTGSIGGIQARNSKTAIVKRQHPRLLRVVERRLETIAAHKKNSLTSYKQSDYPNKPWRSNPPPPHRTRPIGK